MDVDAARKLTQRIYTRLNNRRSGIALAEDYYEGKQPLSFATAEWKKANSERYAGFSDNWCGTVVNAEAERLKPIGLSGIPKAGARRLWDALQYSEFDMQFSQGAVTALTAQRTYVIVWGDGDGKPQVSFEHPANVEIEYDWENPRLRKAALKTWVDESKEYATLYTAEGLYKWERGRNDPVNDLDPQSKQAKTQFATDGGWKPREGVDFWISNPLGVVPVVEIRNRPTLRGEPISEIKGVMPMQDFINLMWAYLMLAADYASMPARVMLGTDPPQIPILDKVTGEVIGKRPVDMKDLAEKRLLNLTSSDAKIDSWEAARLDVFTDVIGVAVGHISSQTRTPPTYLVSKVGMSNVNGEGLKAAELPLVNKSNEFITFTDPALREVAYLCALVQGDEKLAVAARLATINWADREIRSESQLADAMLKKSQMGYPFEYLLEEAGKSPSEISRIMRMRKKELDDALGAGVQAVVQDTFSQGDPDADAA